MKVPGRAWLQFEVEPNSRGAIIRQTAIFDPAGLAGLLYWYLLYPAHRWIFAGMLNEIAAVAERRTGTSPLGAGSKIEGQGSNGGFQRATLKTVRGNGSMENGSRLRSSCSPAQAFP